MLDIILKVLGAVASIVVPWLLSKWQTSQSANANANTALVKLGAIALGMAGRAWDKLAPQVQAALADGTISADERAAIEASVKELLKDFTSEDDLKAIGEALGLPLAGIIAKIASMLIEKFAIAHDPTNPAVSALAYPVSETNVVPVAPVAVASDAG